jgi:hypothetical protein
MKIVCVPRERNGNVVQILEIRDHRVDRHHRHQVADANVFRRTEKFALASATSKNAAARKFFMGLVRPENKCSSGLDP